MEDAIATQALRTEDPSECQGKLQQAADLLKEIQNIMSHEPEMQQLLSERKEILDLALKRFEEIKE